jgi:hypothetical protein
MTTLDFRSLIIGQNAYHPDLFIETFFQANSPPILPNSLFAYSCCRFILSSPKY